MVGVLSPCPYLEKEVGVVGWDGDGVDGVGGHAVGVGDEPPVDADDPLHLPVPLGPHHQPHERVHQRPPALCPLQPPRPCPGQPKCRGLQEVPTHHHKINGRSGS